jgi:hypothetical protein
LTRDDHLPRRSHRPATDDIGPVDPEGMERMLTEYYRLRADAGDPDHVA